MKRALLFSVVASATLCLATLQAAPQAAKAAGAARTITITAHDSPTPGWDTPKITAKPGEELHIVLKATGTMPKMAMAAISSVVMTGRRMKAAEMFTSRLLRRGLERGRAYQF